MIFTGGFAIGSTIMTILAFEEILGFVEGWFYAGVLLTFLLMVTLIAVWISRSVILSMTLIPKTEVANKFKDLKLSKLIMKLALMISTVVLGLGAGGMVMLTLYSTNSILAAGVSQKEALYFNCGLSLTSVASAIGFGILVKRFRKKKMLLVFTTVEIFLMSMIAMLGFYHTEFAVYLTIILIFMLRISSEIAVMPMMWIVASELLESQFQFFGQSVVSLSFSALLGIFSFTGPIFFGKWNHKLFFVYACLTLAFLLFIIIKLPNI